MRGPGGEEFSFSLVSFFSFLVVFLLVTKHSFDCQQLVDWLSLIGASRECIALFRLRQIDGRQFGAMKSTDLRNLRCPLDAGALFQAYGLQPDSLPYLQLKKGVLRLDRRNRCLLINQRHHIRQTLAEPPLAPSPFIVRLQCRRSRQPTPARVTGAYLQGREAEKRARLAARPKESRRDRARLAAQRYVVIVYAVLFLSSGSHENHP